MSKEQIISATAYAIWEAAGRPDGHAEDHWRQAEAQLEQQVADSAPTKKTRAKKRVTPAEQPELIVGGD